MSLLALFWTGGGKNTPWSDFYSILVLQVLVKKMGQIGVVIRKYFDFVEVSSQFSIKISEGFFGHIGTFALLQKNELL